MSTRRVGYYLSFSDGVIDTRRLLTLRKATATALSLLSPGKTIGVVRAKDKVMVLKVRKTGQNVAIVKF